MDERQKWLILLLGAPGGTERCDQVLVMKGLFLLSHTPGHPAQNLYAFEPYAYGPVEARVYRDLDKAQLDDLITVTRVPGSAPKFYDLTDKGQRMFAALREATDECDYAAVQRVKERVTNRSFDVLLKEISAEYPAFVIDGGRLAHA